MQSLDLSSTVNFRSEEALLLRKRSVNLILSIKFLVKIEKHIVLVCLCEYIYIRTIPTIILNTYRLVVRHHYERTDVQRYFLAS